MLKAANQKLAKLYPGDSTARQPVHTFIVGGDLFTSDSAQRAGAEAITTLYVIANLQTRVNEIEVILKAAGLAR